MTGGDFDTPAAIARLKAYVDARCFVPRDLTLSDLRAALGEIERLRGEREWRPIETAPINTDVLLFCPDRGCESNPARIELGQASSGWRNEVANNISRHAWATHWMPIPAPPAMEDAPG